MFSVQRWWILPLGTKYWFDSFGDSACSEFLGTGTVATTGEAEGDYVAVKVLTNSSEGSEQFIGKTYWVVADAEADDGNGYQLYTTPVSTAGTGMYVKIYSEAQKRTVSFSILDSSDDSGISGASVVIGDVTKTTGSSGGCTASLLDGDYEVEVSKEGYTTKTEDITVAYDEVSFTIKLTAS